MVAIVPNFLASEIATDIMPPSQLWNLSDILFRQLKWLRSITVYQLLNSLASTQTFEECQIRINYKSKIKTKNFKIRSNIGNKQTFP